MCVWVWKIKIRRLFVIAMSIKLIYGIQFFFFSFDNLICGTWTKFRFSDVFSELVMELNRTIFIVYHKEVPRYVASITYVIENTDGLKTSQQNKRRDVLILKISHSKCYRDHLGLTKTVETLSQQPYFHSVISLQMNL